MVENGLKILVLAGGESTERQVSLTSAKAVTKALLETGHQVRVIDSLNGNYLEYDRGNFIGADPASSSGSTTALKAAAQVHSPVLSNHLQQTKKEGIDVVFVALHGGSGENGTIQALLELMGVPYTGSPPAASAIAMNKDISKRIMKSLNIPTAGWRRYDRTEYGSLEQVIDEIKNGAPPLPVIIKPRDGGSTVGLSLVEEPDGIDEAVKAAFEVDESIIVERYLSGREITISVLDGAPLPPVEIKPSHKLYDYTCKYTGGKSEYICPAVIDESIVKQLSDDAVKLYHTIGCRGYARIDFIVGSGGEYICLELNTLPGMTELSLFPMAARAVGMDFGQLLTKLCRLAMESK